MSGSVSGAIARLTELASDQWGLVTTAQAAERGVSRLVLSRLVERGILERATHGVYAFPAGEDLHRTLRAEWFALAPAAGAVERVDDPSYGVVSHTSAAEVHGIGDLLADVPEFTLPNRRQSRKLIRLHRTTLLPEEITVREGLSVTTVERTIADLYRDGHDTSHVADALRDAVNSGQVDLESLASAFEPLSGRAGVANGAELVEHLLRIAELDSGSLRAQLALTPMGQSIYALGEMDGVRRAMESIQQSVRVELPPSVKQTLEDLSRSFESASAISEIGKLAAQRNATAADALRQVAETAGTRRATELWSKPVSRRPAMGSGEPDA